MVPPSLDEAADDFNKFLSVFFSDVFPDLASHSVHFMGESYGGHYVPYYTKRMLQRQKQRAAVSVPFKLDSIVMVNPMIDNPLTLTGLYDTFCSTEDGENGFGTGFNETACAAMAAEIPECEILGDVCRATQDRHLCKLSADFCMQEVAKWFEIKEGGLDPYNSKSNS